MFRLASILYFLISSTLAGIFFIIALTAGYDTLYPILIAVGTGFVLALPVSYFVSKHIIEDT